MHPDFTRAILKVQDNRSGARCSVGMAHGSNVDKRRVVFPNHLVFGVGAVMFMPAHPKIDGAAEQDLLELVDGMELEWRLVRKANRVGNKLVRTDHGNLVPVLGQAFLRQARVASVRFPSRDSSPSDRKNQATFPSRCSNGSVDRTMEV